MRLGNILLDFHSLAWGECSYEKSELAVQWMRQKRFDDIWNIGLLLKRMVMSQRMLW